MNVIEKNYKHHSEEDALKILKSIFENPEEYLDDVVLGKIAEQLVEKPIIETEEIPLNETGIHYNIFGAENIEEGALKQMEIAAKLPVAVAGALMPDAHQGYGLPIGGVLATNNTIIPYAVGVDIGCRMCMSIFPIETSELIKKTSFFQRELIENTLFGAGRQFDNFTEHEVLERKKFAEIAFVSGLKNKAAKQLGSSGSGNHFVEFGEVEITDANNSLNLKSGKYVALLSHSGSRGLGATIAFHYTQIAMEKAVLPREAKHLAWLDLDTEEGMEYWLAMNLAGAMILKCN